MIVLFLGRILIMIAKWWEDIVRNATPTWLVWPTNEANVTAS